MQGAARQHMGLQTGQYATNAVRLAPCILKYQSLADVVRRKNVGHLVHAVIESINPQSQEEHQRAVYGPGQWGHRVVRLHCRSGG